jgi:hypothetical protein
MKLETLLTQVQPQWKGEFVRFIETGEADEGFLSYLDNNSDAQQAVEMAFKAQASAFENLAEELKKTPPEKEVGIVIETAKPVGRVSAKLAAVVAEAVKDVSKLPPKEKEETLEQIVSTLKTSMDSAELDSARSVGKTLAKAL